MSHFSKIKTKIKNKDNLIKALLTLGYQVDLNQQLDNPEGHNHPKLLADISIGDSMGFVWTGGTFEFVTDVQMWDKSIPIKRFLEKITQHYALVTLSNKSKDEGFEIVSQTTNMNNAIELEVEKWV